MCLFGIIFLLVSTVIATPALAERALFAVATNFAETAEQLALTFEAETGHEVEFAFGATGKIYAQILRGAPFDGFLAADQLRPQLLHEGGQGDAPFTYAQGVLVWWPDLESDGLRGRLAIANPDLAPYGVAARETLQNMGVWEAWQAQLVMGENVGQAFAMVATGNAQIGLVALSSVKSPRNTKDWTWRLAKDHAPVLQDAILLNKGRDNDAAIAFLAYLKSDAAQALITGAGYEPVDHD